MKKGIFRKILKYRVIAVFFIIDIIAIIAMIVFYILNWTPLASILSSFAALFSSLIALLLPLIIKFIDKIEDKEKVLESREKGYRAFEELCHYYFQQFDIKKGVPKENIEVINRTKMISQVQIIYTYRKELFPIGIIISSGWKDVEGDQNIYIHTKEELDIRILAHDFGKIRKIELKNKGSIVKDKSEIKDSLEKIKNRINTVEL